MFISVSNIMGKTYRPSPLLQSIYSSDLEGVKIHIQNGIDVNKSDGSIKPLRAASGNMVGQYSFHRTTLGRDMGRLEIVKLLLENGARINPSNVFSLDDDNDYTGPSFMFV